MRVFHILILCSLASSSCAPDHGEARFEVAQVALLSDCMRRAFPFEPIDLRAQRHPGSTSLFFQHNPGPQRSADLLTIEVFADAPIDQPIPLAIARNPAPQPWEPVAAPLIAKDRPSARATLQLLNACPLIDEALIVEGELTFSEFGRSPGDQITGRLDARILDARSGQTVAGSLTGDFSFTVDHGRAGENLYDARRD